MTDHCRANGFGNGTGVDQSVSLLEATKEEKAVSLREREEDERFLRQPHHGNTNDGPGNNNNNGNDSNHVHNPHEPSNNDTGDTGDTKPINDNDNDNNDHNDDDDTDASELRRRLACLRKRRKRIREHPARAEWAFREEALREALNEGRRDRQRLADEYASALRGRDHASLFLDVACRWNVLNDCFHVWIGGGGAFATINGCRLGAEAPPLPPGLRVASREEAGIGAVRKGGKWVVSGNTSEPGKQAPRRRLLGFFGSDPAEQPAAAAPAASATPGLQGSLPPASEPTRVPWPEVNAALGHACLLLKILQEASSKNAGTGMRFTHELFPMGCTSKIGIRFGTPDSSPGVLAAATGLGSLLATGKRNLVAAGPSAPITYNLFFEEAPGFSFFKNHSRDFNWALQAFLQCVAEAASQQTDKTIAIPHAIRHETAGANATSGSAAGANSSNNNNSNSNNAANFLNGGEWTIGGLSICYHHHEQGRGERDGSGPERGASASPGALEWTRACRYLLTNLKWLVAYSAKHVDR